MTQGSLTPTTYPSETITVICDECGREGKYARSVLIERYGADTPMPDILNRITDCTRNRRLSVDRCKAVFGELRG
jgi:hypothetical protein